MKLGQSLYQMLWRARWLPLSARKSIYKKLADLDAAPDAPFVTDFFGLKYQGNLNNSIEFSLYYFGAFEKPLLFFMRDCLQALTANTKDSGIDSVFCDIGANIGQHSLFMSQFADHVLAFEPYGPVREKLQFHIELNQIMNIAVHPVGLSQQAETLPFFAPTGRNQGIGSFDAATISKGNKETGHLQLVKGDDFLESQHLPPLTLVKIDVEGFEKNVLSGLRETLAKDRPVLVTEITYGNALSFASLNELLSLLPPDYHLFAFNTRKADGSKARKRGARAKLSGEFELIDFRHWRETGQDDIVACPSEKLALLPRKGLPAHH